MNLELPAVLKSALRTLVLLLLTVGLLPGCAVHRGEVAIQRPYRGVTCRFERRQDPPNRWWIAQVDLTNPHLRLRVAPGGPDPDGPGRWQTTLMRPTQIAARESFSLVVNGDFFDARGTKDAEGTNSTYCSVH